MKDQSDDPSHHERTLLQQSYISLLSAIITKTNSWLKFQDMAYIICGIKIKNMYDTEINIIYIQSKMTDW